MNVVMPEMEAMKNEVENLTNLFLDFLVQTKSRQTVNVADIARMEGVSVSQLRKGGKERYLLPRFGESGYPTGSVRWDLSEYLDWRRKPAEERLNAYNAHLRAKYRVGR